jgi:hypothetical protein
MVMIGESGAILQSGVTAHPLAMAEIVRVFNEEKEARGWGAKRRFYVTTEQHRAYELIEAKLDAAESQSANVTRAAEGRARASYMRYEKITSTLACRSYRDDLATGTPKAH